MAATVQKVSVALGLEDLAWLRHRAEHQHESLSAVLTAAIRATREREELLDRQRVAVAAYVHWATDGEGLPARALAAAELELQELAATDLTRSLSSGQLRNRPALPAADLRAGTRKQGRDKAAMTEPRSALAKAASQPNAKRSKRTEQVPRARSARTSK